MDDNEALSSTDDDEDGSGNPVRVLLYVGLASVTAAIDDDDDDVVVVVSISPELCRMAASPRVGIKLGIIVFEEEDDDKRASCC